MFGRLAKLKSGQKILDVGSGYGSPAINWKKNYAPIDIICININQHQLVESKNRSSIIDNMAATATLLPFDNSSVDRILSFESAQHFKPFEDFVSESHRVLKEDGLLAIAIPVMAVESSAPIAKLGLLSMTWSSEHYSAKYVIESLEEKFQTLEKKEIGSKVYEPLADYYNENRQQIRQRILQKYPSYVEKILFKSINKMKQVSQSRVIDYLLVTCQK